MRRLLSVYFFCLTVAGCANLSVPPPKYEAGQVVVHKLSGRKGQVTQQHGWHSFGVRFVNKQAIGVSGGVVVLDGFEDVIMQEFEIEAADESTTTGAK